jgi:hypothetical protein
MPVSASSASASVAVKRPLRVYMTTKSLENDENQDDALRYKTIRPAIRSAVRLRLRRPRLMPRLKGQNESKRPRKAKAKAGRKAKAGATILIPRQWVGLRL